MKRLFFWLSAFVAASGYTLLCFAPIKAPFVNAILGIVATLALSYVIAVAEKRIDLKLAERWTKYCDDCERDELEELTEHLDALDSAAQSNDGELIVDAREAVIDLVIELQQERRDRHR
jgi:hypothetical protein